MSKMSLVREVLSSAGKLEKDDLTARVQKLTKRIEDIKVEVQECLKNRYIDFLPHFTGTINLTDRLSAASSEVNELLKKIEEEIQPKLEGTVNIFQSELGQLQETTVLAQMMERLVKMQECLETAEEAEINKNYLLAAQNLLKVQQLLSNPVYECEKELEVLSALKTEYFVRKEKLIYDLREIWNQQVVWTVPESEGLDYQDVHLKLVTSAFGSHEEIMNFLQALHLLGHLKEMQKVFGRNLLSLLLQPVILKKSQLKVNNNADVISLEVRSSKSVKADAADAFEHLIAIFKFLYTSFMKTQVSQGDKPEDGSDVRKETLMSVLGDLISEQFCNFLIKECLAPAIPSQSKHLEKYYEVIDMTANLQDYLLEIGFLNPEQTSVLDYARSIDVLFANKICQDILSQARNLLQKDLHETVIVPNESDSADLLKTSSSLEGESENLGVKHGLSKSAFRFPKCKISVFTRDIVQLLHTVMQEASRNSSPCALRLFYTSRHICEMFCDIVPIYHKDSITNLPQQTALYHNNCMYLAHHLMTLGHQYQGSLPPPLGNSCITFIDLVPQLRKLGTEAFLAQMRRQRDQILELLKEQTVFQNAPSDNSFHTRAEKAVRQCLYQLQLLQRVWAGVLPDGVCCRALGTLLNSFLDEIILHITSMEDITADYSSQLDSVFGIVIKEAPGLFSVLDQSGLSVVYKYVRKWHKFKELQLVLTATMRDIVDRWADGKGPLAAEFSAEEVKQLIRALFRNTDRRAAALSKIR